MNFDDMLPPVVDLGVEFETAIAAWRWCVGASALWPILINAFGDVFVYDVAGVYLLDTRVGAFTRVARTREEWKDSLTSAKQVAEWFYPEFVQHLMSAGRRLGSGEVYSPTIPEILGGGRTAENYTPSPWRSHLHILGQVHEQVRSLAPGATIESIEIT
jgi:hypothetical protein